MYGLLRSGIVFISVILIIIFILDGRFYNVCYEDFSVNSKFIKLINVLRLLLYIITTSTLFVCGYFVIAYIQNDSIPKSTFSDGIKYLSKIIIISTFLWCLLKVFKSILLVFIKRQKNRINNNIDEVK